MPFTEVSHFLQSIVGSKKIDSCHKYRNITYNVIFVHSGTHDFQPDLIILLDDNILGKVRSSFKTRLSQRKLAGRTDTILAG